MVEIILSFIAGFSFAFFLRLLVIARREKKGLYEIRYKRIPPSAKLKMAIREIIFKFSIQKFNRDFLLNIISNGTPIVQIMHRSNFPEICKDIEDIKFGLAIYIPTKPLSIEQNENLLQVLKQESEAFHPYMYPIGYYVIDAGSRVRYTGYLLTRIIREVFKIEEVELRLYDEGVLPYRYDFKIDKGDLPLS